MRFLKILWPDSLFGQAVIVLLAGLTVSHFASMLIYSTDRVESLILMGSQTTAQRAANLSHLIVDAPEDWRSRLVGSLSEPGFRVTLAETPPAPLKDAEGSGNWRALAIRRYVETLLPEDSLGPILVDLIDFPSHAIVSDFDWATKHIRMMFLGRPLKHKLRITVGLTNDAWVSFEADIAEPPSLWSSEAALSMALMGIAVILFSVWVVQRLTRPLRNFSQAAERLGRDVTAPPLDEKGPKEVRQAAKTFNDMQSRLRRLVENRTRMLAAISHDLRTPITHLRLRAEFIENVEDRGKTLEALDHMEEMIAATLAFAREDNTTEVRRKVDLAALVDTICADLTDAGGDIEVLTPEHLSVECAPLAMRRAITNIIVNAIKYGERARVILREAAQGIEIIIEDNGPGIPEEYFANVFQPFFRLDSARQSGFGGNGLGLTIAQTVAHEHGGTIVLKNNTDGGLSVFLNLPTAENYLPQNFNSECNKN